MSKNLDPMTIATDPRFQNDSEALFNEMAKRYGRDATGFAWVAASLAYEQVVKVNG